METLEWLQTLRTDDQDERACIHDAISAVRHRLNTPGRHSIAGFHWHACTSCALARKEGGICKHASEASALSSWLTMDDEDLQCDYFEEME